MFEQSPQKIIDHCCRNLQIGQIEVAQVLEAQVGQVVRGLLGAAGAPAVVEPLTLDALPG